ncbi:UDP-Glc:alpha-D-GlcNAc-diphosphoundecaprenol beta-1,3-glucosyltransferase WfgD [bacterium HR37]|nr:UDP-Glc:alpha-D-GlcNAc-diphosphoundecaprenol beta-1,3-glucosyltransferase WfgD [bacterium HR37]
MPEVSVIIPTYNRAGFLRSAIRSVLNQTFQDFEIIVVDDGSIDCSAKEVVNEFRDPRIRYIRHEVNRGGSAARNTGIKASRGRYIAFLDDDDEWLPEKLQKQIEVLYSSPERVGGVYTGFLILDRSNERLLRRWIPSKRGYLLSELAKENCIKTTSTLLLRKECFDKVGLFDENLASSQDYDMWIRISKKFHFECVEEPLVKYYMHENKITTNYENLINGMESMLEKHHYLFASNRRSYSYRYFILGVLYCLWEKDKKGRELIFKAIKLYPFDIRYYFNLGLSLLGVKTFKKIKELRSRLGVSLLLRKFVTK